MEGRTRLSPGNYCAEDNSRQHGCSKASSASAAAEASDERRNPGFRPGPSRTPRQPLIVGFENFAEVKPLVEKKAVAGIFVTDHNVGGRKAADVAKDIQDLQGYPQSPRPAASHRSRRPGRRICFTTVAASQMAADPRHDHCQAQNRRRARESREGIRRSASSRARPPRHHDEFWPRR